MTTRTCNQGTAEETSSSVQCSAMVWRKSVSCVSLTVPVVLWHKHIYLYVCIFAVGRLLFAGTKSGRREKNCYKWILPQSQFWGSFWQLFFEGDSKLFSWKTFCRHFRLVTTEAFCTRQLFANKNLVHICIFFQATVNLQHKMMWHFGGRAISTWMKMGLYSQVKFLLKEAEHLSAVNGFPKFLLLLLELMDKIVAI